MTVSRVMTNRVVTIGLDETLEDVQEIFQQAHFHHLLVLADDGKVAGVISDRDLLKQLSPFLNTPAEQLRDLATLKKRAHQIMSRRLIVASLDTTIEDAARLLVDNSISCLPVLDEDGVMKGIVTWKDILCKCFAG